MAVLRTYPQDSDSIHLCVVYDENAETLDLRWLSGIRNRMRRDLGKLVRASW